MRNKYLWGMMLTTFLLACAFVFVACSNDGNSNSGDGLPDLLGHWPLTPSATRFRVINDDERLPLTDDIVGTVHATYVSPLVEWPQDEQWGRQVIEVTAENNDYAGNKNWGLVMTKNPNPGLYDHTTNPDDWAYPQFDKLTVTFWAKPQGPAGLSANPPAPHERQVMVGLNAPYRYGNFPYFFGGQNNADGYGLGLGFWPSKGSFWVEDDMADFTDRWTHFALVFNGETARLYINGKDKGLSEENEEPMYNIDTPPLDAIVLYGMATSHFFYGRMADLRLYYGALSASQIEAIRNLAPVAVRDHWKQ